jgi:hypothetical protein
MLQIKERNCAKHLFRRSRLGTLKIVSMLIPQVKALLMQGFVCSSLPLWHWNKQHAAYPALAIYKDMGKCFKIIKICVPFFIIAKRMQMQ